MTRPRTDQSVLFKLPSPSMEADLREQNPWWKGQRVAGLPQFRRTAFQTVLTRLQAGLAPAVVLRGPRQIGKTTLLLQVVDALLDAGIAPQRILRVQFDEVPWLRELKEPILDLSRWFAQEVLRQSFNEAALVGVPAFLLFDEVQNLTDWATQLKHLVDIHPVRVLVTGSSALRIEEGRDSLAGRLTTLEIGPLVLREVAGLRGFGEVPSLLPENGVAPLKDKEFWRSLRALGQQHQRVRDGAFQAFSERGGYPVAQLRTDRPWEEVADQLNETVVRRAIQHDLRGGERGRRRDERLLEEVFRLACRYTGQSPSQALYLDEVRRSLSANIGWQRILAYLRLLDGTLLIRLIDPLELRLKRRRGAPKLVLCDHALRAAWLQEVVPIDPGGLEAAPHLADLGGRIADSIVGYFLRSIVGLDVAHFPERGAEREVDYVLTVGQQRIPLEVKYRRRVGFDDTRGLRGFLEHTVYNAPFGVLVTQTDDVQIDDPRIAVLPLSSFLLLK